MPDCVDSCHLVDCCTDLLQQLVQELLLAGEGMEFDWHSMGSLLLGTDAASHSCSRFPAAPSVRRSMVLLWLYLSGTRSKLPRLRRPQYNWPVLQVRLLPSFSHDTKGMLLAAATAVLYTPTDEHFGIVPLEVNMLRDGRVLHCNIALTKQHYAECTLQVLTHTSAGAAVGSALVSPMTSPTVQWSTNAGDGGGAAGDCVQQRRPAGERGARPHRLPVRAHARQLCSGDAAAAGAALCSPGEAPSVVLATPHACVTPCCIMAMQTCGCQMHRTEICCPLPAAVNGNPCKCRTRMWLLRWDARRGSMC